MKTKKIKSISKKIGRFFLWITGGFVALILLVLILLTIPKVQTYLAKKATNFLSEKMETTVSIDKLRIDFGLNICFENLHLNDQRNNNLISVKKGKAGFLFLRRTEKNTHVLIRPIVLDSADVTLRRYEGDTALNIQFFVNFVKQKEKNDKIALVDLQNVQLKNSRFQCRMDDTYQEDEPGVWNYRDIRLDGINLKLKQLMIVGDSLTFQIDQLSAREHSGFQLDKLTGKLIVCRKGLYCLNTRLQTENATDLSLDFRFEYSDFSDFGNFIYDVSFNSEIHEGVFNLKDLGYFAGKLQGMETKVNVAAKANGPISDFKLKNTHLSFGQGTTFDGDVSLTGLPNIEETFIDLNIKDLRTNITDLEQFTLPKQGKIPIPALVPNLEWVKLQGHFIGLYNNFFSDMELSTALGDGSCELMLNARVKPISYDGKLKVQHLMLGNLLQYNDLGMISAEAEIKGKGVAIQDMDLHGDATVFAIEYKNQMVENIVLRGDVLSKQFNGLVQCEDEDFNLVFNGNIDFNQKKPIYNFDMDVRAINLSDFQLFRPDSNVIVSAKIKTDLQGNNIDSMQGSLLVENFVYTENAKQYTIPNIKLIINQLGGINQHLSLLSEVLDIDIKGEFTYKYALKELQRRIHAQLSNLVPNPISQHSDVPQKVAVSLQMKKNIPLLEHFFPMVTAPEGLSVKLSFNEANNVFSLGLETPRLTVKNYLIDHVKVDANQQTNAFDVMVNCGAYRFKKNDSIADVQNFKLHSSIQNNRIDFTVNAVGNDKNKIEDIRLESSVGFEAKNELWVNIKKGGIVWNSNTFVFDTLNHAHITPRNIYVENFGLYSLDRQKSIHVKSASSLKSDNNLDFKFKKIDLGLFDMILNSFQISLEGSATGSGKLIQTPEGIGIGSNIQVENMVFNDVSMGFLDANTVWLNQEKKLYIGASLYESPNNSNRLLLSVKGYLDPINKFINMDGDINSFNIKILEKYLKSFASKVEGWGTGHLTFSGKLADPQLKGDILLKNAVLGIAFLNTEYKIDEGKLYFVDTGFIFDNVPVRDSYNGKGLVNGIITHKRLRNWGTDLRIQAENMMGLNTTSKDNTLFYGKAFATGNVTLKGRVDDLISIAIDVSTNPQTDMTLSLDWATTAVESNFITFVSHQKEKAEEKIDVPKTKLAVNLKVKATPDATVHVLLDPSIGGDIVGKGNGIMEIILDENDKFSIFGKYTLVNGDFNLAYADVFTRTFKLENNSTLSWNGDPMQGVMNVKAVQMTKASIAAFAPQYAQLISVNNIIHLHGNILKPNFSFSFDLPDVDENARSLVYNSIDTTDKEEMIKQMVYLLIFRKFASQESQVGTSVENTLGNSISELISHQINRIISGLISDLDMHVIYQPGTDGETRREYITDIKKSWLDGKLIVQTSVGVVEGIENNADNQFLGDFLIEYVFKNSLRIKGFNLYNQRDLQLYNAKYSQGIGLSYSKNFDKFKDLFTRKKKREKME